MTNIELDMIQTAGIGALALVVGMVLTRKIAFLQRFCIPSPVSGGIIFSLLTLALYGWFHIEVAFDATLKDIFMLAFFTSVGFQSDLKVLKQGGKTLIVMLILLVIIITMQNLMPLGITRLMDVNSLVAIATGSVSMTGGHGTAGSRYNRYGCCYFRTDCRINGRGTFDGIDHPQETEGRTNAAAG